MAERCDIKGKGTRRLKAKMKNASSPCPSCDLSESSLLFKIRSPLFMCHSQSSCLQYIVIVVRILDEDDTKIGKKSQIVHR